MVFMCLLSVPSFADAGWFVTAGISGGAGSGTIDPAGTRIAVEAPSKQFVVTPNSPQFKLSAVKVNGKAVLPEADGVTYTVTQPPTEGAEKKIIAYFVPQFFRITTKAGAGGAITAVPAGPLSKLRGGATATVAINAKPGYAIEDVVVDGASVGAVASKTFANLSADHTVSATFAKSLANAGVDKTTL
ncbi:MAG TPA: hypothetical protein VNX25_04665, partial [Verrucomicrobiae bacterium]|nr:hypothetical protein [Verrucomicrobiae bacterium]